MALQPFAVGFVRRGSHLTPKCVCKRQMSSLNDAISDIFGSKKKKPRPDELDAVKFEVTRLNDTMAGARAALLDAMAGPAAGDAEREAARRMRTNLAFKDLLKSVPQGQTRDAVSSALVKFEGKESERKERLGQSLGAWRKKQLTLLAEEKPETFLFKCLNLFGGNKGSSPEKDLGEQLKNELDLFKELTKAGIGAETVEGIVHGASLLMDTKVSERETTETERKCVHVLDFAGDRGASKAVQLSEEISAILSLPSTLLPVEVVLRLSSPGGTVTGYGRCSAELERLTKSGLDLTICVDEMAASGGYLMASVASKIYAAPLAAIGSIGVVASTPNVAKRMQDEGVCVIQSTAGKYKRTVTPWKEPSAEELNKLQEDVDTIQRHFVDRVAHQRRRTIPDVSQVATGEVWYGKDALERGLVDELMTSEEYIQQRIAEGCEVLHIKKASSRVSLPWWLSTDLEDAGSLGGGGSFNLPLLERLRDDVISIEDVMRIAQNLPVHKRRALVKSLMRA